MSDWCLLLHITHYTSSHYVKMPIQQFHLENRDSRSLISQSCAISEYKLTSWPCGWFPRLQDNICNFWWNVWMSEGCTDKWTASSFVLDKVNVSDLDWMVNDVWWTIYREILEKWDHHWKPKLCAPPGSNHDPRRMALLDFRYAGPYQTKWRESIKFCISPLNTKCIYCKCLMIWIPWNIFWSLLLR